MTLTQLSTFSVKKLSNSELISLHHRVHQLYGGAKKRNLKPEFIKFLVAKHHILEKEIMKRKLHHKTPLRENINIVDEYLQILFEKKI